jgi:hypothetical protein
VAENDTARADEAELKDLADEIAMATFTSCGIGSSGLALRCYQA